MQRHPSENSSHWQLDFKESKLHINSDDRLSLRKRESRRRSSRELRDLGIFDPIGASESVTLRSEDIRDGNLKKNEARRLLKTYQQPIKRCYHNRRSRTGTSKPPEGGLWVRT